VCNKVELDLLQQKSCFLKLDARFFILEGRQNSNFQCKPLKNLCIWSNEEKLAKKMARNKNKFALLKYREQLPICKIQN
jgi:hypothetical protein